MASHQATGLTDPLTGLANYRTFMEGAQPLFDSDIDPIAIVAFNLDRLKAVNARFGHPTGDQTLRILAYCLLRSLEPPSMAGRVSGDVFVALLPNCSLETAVIVADKIRAGFQDSAQIVNGQCVNATVSVGVSLLTTFGSARGFSHALACANRALDQAKTLGGNRVTADESNDRSH